MTQDQRRLLLAAKHAHIYKPSLMKSKTLDFLEVFLLQSQCRLNELYALLAGFMNEDTCSTDEDEKVFWSIQTELARLQSDITKLIYVRESLDSVDGDFDRAAKGVTNDTIDMYIKQAREETEKIQDPTDEIRSKLEKLL